MPHSPASPSDSAPASLSGRQYDAAIIGAGPSGIFAAFQCGMLGIKAIVIDALSHIGGQCSALYPEKPIYDIPAYPSITGEELTQALYTQAKVFNIPYLLKRKAVRLTGKTGEFVLTTDREDEIQAKTVIIAAGPGAFGPNRPPLSNIEVFEDGGFVHYSIRNSKIFKNSTIVIAGGGDSALDWAVALSEMAKKIYLVHRRDKFRGHQATLEKVEKNIKNGKIEKITPFQLHELKGENDILKSVCVKSLDGEEKELPADHLLAFFGLSSDLKALQDWEIDLEKSGIAVDPATMATSRKGVFAIGDVAKYPGKAKLILQGFAEAAISTREAWKLIHPDQSLHFEHSTSQGVPNAPPDTPIGTLSP